MSNPPAARAEISQVMVTPDDLNRGQLQRAFALTLVHTLFPGATASDAKRIAQWVVKGEPRG